jgi:hypothetical protein
MKQIAKLEDAVKPSIRRRPARAGAVFEKSRCRPDAQRMRRKRRRRDITKRPQQRESGQIDTPRWLWWTEKLTKIITRAGAAITTIANLIALITHWLPSK